jgi:hypothetical protein
MPIIHPFNTWKDTGAVDLANQSLAERERAKDRFTIPCMHDQCSQCKGTGERKDGLGVCVHMISCPCPKCSPRY